MRFISLDSSCHCKRSSAHCMPTRKGRDFAGDFSTSTLFRRTVIVFAELWKLFTFPVDILLFIGDGFETYLDEFLCFPWIIYHFGEGKPLKPNKGKGNSVGNVACKQGKLEMGHHYVVPIHKQYFWPELSR
jgi:hypothetical protein